MCNKRLKWEGALLSEKDAAIERLGLGSGLLPLLGQMVSYCSLPNDLNTRLPMGQESGYG